MASHALPPWRRTAAASARSASTISSPAPAAPRSTRSDRRSTLAVGLEALAQGLAQAAGSAGQQQFFVNLDCHGVHGVSGLRKRLDFAVGFATVAYHDVSHMLSDDLRDSGSLALPLSRVFIAPPVQTPRCRRCQRRCQPFRRAARRAAPRGLVRPKSWNSLAASIRDGPLQPGDKLPTEAEMMARFDVSRTVVRESISRLQASGLVRDAPRHRHLRDRDTATPATSASRRTTSPPSPT